MSITDESRTGDADRVSVVFAHGECELVRKMLRRAGAAIACGLSPEWTYQLLFKMREAERDFAYQVFGSEWRKHVSAFFRSEPTDEERRLLATAAEMRPDLFKDADSAGEQWLTALQQLRDSELLLQKAP